MKKLRIFAALLLSFSLVMMTACGTKSSALDEPEENIVEVDFTNISYDSSDSITSQTNNNIVSSEAEEIPQSLPEESEISSELGDTSSKGESLNDYRARENSSDSDLSSDETSSKEEIPDFKPRTPNGYPEGSAVDVSWFDDCMFLGDSLTVGLSMYNDATGTLGMADFVCSSGLSYFNSQWDLNNPSAVHPSFHGQYVRIEDAPAMTGATKVIIGLGMNDLGMLGVRETLVTAKDLLDSIRIKNPGVTIYLETITPMIPQKEQANLNNALIREYDESLELFAREQNCRFLNTWSALADENGELPYYLCGDAAQQGIHLTLEGYGMVADYILHNVK